MAVIKQGILGGFSGSVGSVVGSSWKGIAVVKAKPLSVANPQTAGQVAQRTKFSNCVGFAVAITATVIKPLWDRFASKQSGYNAFIQANIELFENAMPNPYTELILSKGKIASSVLSTAVLGVASKNLQIAWDDDSGSGFKLATDEMYLVLMNLTKNWVEPIATGVARSEGGEEYSVINALTIGDNLRLAFAYRRADGTLVSNTGYKGVTLNA